MAQASHNVTFGKASSKQVTRFVTFKLIGTPRLAAITAFFLALLFSPPAKASGPKLVSDVGSIITVSDYAATRLRSHSSSGSGIMRRLEPETVTEYNRLRALEGIGGGPRSIIGADNRIRVTNTTVYPNRAIVLVTFSEGRCSGFLVSKDTVMTSGHCVHRGYGGSTGWFPLSSYTIYPGRNGTSSPFGKCKAARLYTNTGWTVYGNTGRDFGFIKLNCDIGNTVGWFGFRWQTDSLNGASETIAGYPGDKPLQQWKSSGTIQHTSTNRIFYRNDTYPGMSGSPVYNFQAGCGQCSMGIHGYGVDGLTFPHTLNHAIRITDVVFDQAMTVIALP